MPSKLPDISGLLLLMMFMMMPTYDVMSVAGKLIMQIMSDVDDIRLCRIISPLGSLHKIEILPQHSQPGHGESGKG